MVWGAPVPHHGLPPPRLLEPPPVSRPVRAGGGTTGETAAARSSGENGETLHRAGRPSGGRLWWFGNASRFPRFFLCNCESRSYWWLSVIDGVRCCCKMVKLTPAPRYRVTPALLQELQSFQWIPNIIRPNSLLWWNSEIDPSDSSPTKWHRVGQSGDCRQIVERSRWGCKTCQVVSKSGTRCPRWHRWWHQVYPSPWHHLAWHPSPPQLCQCHRSLSQKKFGCAEIYAKYGKLDHRKSTQCLLILSWIKTISREHQYFGFNCYLCDLKTGLLGTCLQFHWNVMILDLHRQWGGEGWQRVITCT